MPEEIVKNETTNAVLKESIIGLSKLTDERFKNIQDTLLRIEGNSHGYATKLELDEAKKDFTATIKRIEEGMAKHNEDDKISFAQINVGQTQTQNTLLKWGAIGGVVLFVFSFLSPVILKKWFPF